MVVHGSAPYLSLVCIGDSSSDEMNLFYLRGLVRLACGGPQLVHANPHEHWLTHPQWWHAHP